jgi:hypothetical protein
MMDLDAGTLETVTGGFQRDGRTPTTEDHFARYSRCITRADKKSGWKPWTWFSRDRQGCYDQLMSDFEKYPSPAPQGYP